MALAKWQRCGELVMTRGTMVIARGYGGVAKVVRVWDYDSDAVYLAGDERFAKLANGRLDAFPVGAHWKDVFEMDEHIAAQLATRTHLTPDEWASMRPWKPVTELST